MDGGGVLREHEASARDGGPTSEHAMTDHNPDASTAWWGKNLDDVDTEIARMAAICQVHILDPNVIDRVIRNDASVCGSANPKAFEKLHHLMMMHYQIREKAVGAIGQAETQALINQIVERLRQRIGAPLGTPPA
jgi:hypothetical protein